MAVDPEFGRRARIALAQMDKPLAMKEIAEQVKRLAKRSTLTSQAVGGWFRGQEPESFQLTRAFAQVLGCDPGWLAFGEGATRHSELSNVADVALPDPTLDRRLSVQEAQRGLRAAEIEEREESAAAKKVARKRRGGCESA